MASPEFVTVGEDIVLTRGIRNSISFERGGFPDAESDFELGIS